MANEMYPIKLIIKKEDRLFVGIIILVHILFFIMACVYKRIYMGDSFEYIYEALNIKHYFFFYSGNPALPISPEYMTQRQPGYPLLLFLVYLFTVNNWVVVVLQNILSIFNVCFARKIFTTLGHQQKHDKLLLLFIIAYPAQFINANTIAPDILLQTFALLYFGNFVALWQRAQLKYALWMSLALVTGMMVKPVLYPFVVIHTLILLFVAARQKMNMQRPLLIALVPLCAMLSYNYWNFTRTGKFHFSSNQSFNAIYYYYSYFSMKEGADSAGKFLANERREIAAIPEYKDRYDYANAHGLMLLQQNFGPYMAFHVKNAARIFIEPGKAEMDLFTGKLTYGRLYSKQQTGFFVTWKARGIYGMGQYISYNTSMLFVVLVLLFNLLRLVGLIHFLGSRKAHWVIRTFIVVYLVYFAVAAGPIANTRYFLPVSLIAICCGAVGLSELMDKKITQVGIEE